MQFIVFSTQNLFIFYFLLLKTPWVVHPESIILSDKIITMKRKRKNRSGRHRPLSLSQWTIAHGPSAIPESDNEIIRDITQDILLALQSPEHRHNKPEAKPGTKKHHQTQPYAAFYGNSINFGPIGGQGKATAVSSVGKDDPVEMIRRYEQLIAEKDQKIKDLKSDLEIFIPNRDEWKEAG